MSHNFDLNIKNVLLVIRINQFFRDQTLVNIPLAPPEVRVRFEREYLEVERFVEVAKVQPLKLECDGEVFAVLVAVGQGGAVR